MCIRDRDKKVGSLIGLSFYQQQMSRIAENKKVQPTTNAWGALLFSLRHQGLSALMPQRNKE